jgi:hypothetical protein
MAEAARTASQDSQAAADRHATVIERRLAALAETAKAARAQAPARSAAHVDEHTQDFSRARGAAGGATISRLTPAPRPQSAQDWRAKADDDVFHMSPANERGADPFGLANAADPDASLVAQVMEALAEAGVRAGEALTSTDLERIAGRARYGAAARRRAVNEAAPGAVQRLSRHFRRSAQAKEIANAFRSRPDLAKVNRRGDNADVVCAYLLIDAALS